MMKASLLLILNSVLNIPSRSVTHAEEDVTASYSLSEIVRSRPIEGLDSHHDLSTSESRSTSQTPRHGIISYYHGQPFRWHQFGHGMWQGIRPEVWDDPIHIRNDTVLNDTSVSISERQVPVRGSLDSLDEAYEHIVRATVICTKQVYDKARLCISDVIGSYLIRVVSHAGKSVWAFLNQPFIAGVASALIGAWTTHSLFPLGKSSDAVMIRIAVAQTPSSQCLQEELSSFQSGNMTQNITIEVIPNEQKASEKCGTPPRNLLSYQDPDYALAPVNGTWMKIVSFVATIAPNADFQRFFTGMWIAFLAQCAQVLEKNILQGIRTLAPRVQLNMGSYTLDAASMNGDPLRIKTLLEIVVKLKEIVSHPMAMALIVNYYIWGAEWTLLSIGFFMLNSLRGSS